MVWKWSDYRGARFVLIRYIYSDGGCFDKIYIVTVNQCRKI